MAFLAGQASRPDEATALAGPAARGRGRDGRCRARGSRARQGQRGGVRDGARARPDRRAPGAIQLGLAAEPLWHRRYADADRNGQARARLLQRPRPRALPPLRPQLARDGRARAGPLGRGGRLGRPDHPHATRLDLASHPRADDGRARARAPRRSRSVVAARRGVRRSARPSGELGRMLRPRPRVPKPRGSRVVTPRSRELTDVAVRARARTRDRLGRSARSASGGTGRGCGGADRRCRRAACARDPGRPRGRGGALGRSSAARTRRRSRSPTPATRTRSARRSTSCNGSARRRRPRACAAPACAGCRAGRAGRRARTRRT